jgi:hypothetical protein
VSETEVHPELTDLLKQCDRDLRHMAESKDYEDVDTLLDFRLMIMEAEDGPSPRS